MKILVTGAAGFIGSHTAHKLLTRGYEVVGLDNLNEYYDVTLKQARLARLASQPGFRLAARTCLSTRSIQSTKGACFAGAIQTNPRCTSTAAPASRGLMQQAPYLGCSGNRGLAA